MLKRISKLFKKKPLGLEGAWDNSLLEEEDKDETIILNKSWQLS